MTDIRLTDQDRTVFAVCLSCNKSALGMKAPQYYSMAYTRKQWARAPKCENCHTDMQFKYEVGIDE